MEEEVRLKNFQGVSKFKSIKRAIRRGHVTRDGMIVPNKPFNNRGNTSKRKDIHSRVTNEYKKEIYGQLIRRYQNQAV